MLQVDELQIGEQMPSIEFFMMTDAPDEASYQPIRSGSKIYIQPLGVHPYTEEKHSMTMTCVLRDDDMNNYVATAHHGCVHISQKYQFLANDGTPLASNTGIVVSQYNMLLHDTSSLPPELYATSPKTDLVLIKLSHYHNDHTIQGVPSSADGPTEAIISGYYETDRPSSACNSVQYWGSQSKLQIGKIYRSEAWVKCNYLPRGAILVEINAKEGDSGALITTSPSDEQLYQSGSYTAAAATMIPENAFSYKPMYAPSSMTLNLSNRETFPHASTKTCKAISSIVGKYNPRGSLKERHNIMLTLPVRPAIENFQLHLRKILHFHKPNKNYPAQEDQEVFV